jgi:transmembrane sensor
MTPERLRILIDRYLQDTASPAEEQELNAWYQASNQHDVQWPVSRHDEAAELKARMRQKLQHAMHPAAPVPKIPFYRKKAWQSAAAILIMVSAAGAWFLWDRQAQNSVAANQHSATKPVVPGGDKAILTLGDGRIIILDSVSNGNIAQEGNMAITKKEGMVVYDASHAPLTTDHSPSYNTISTPRGGQYRIVLPDGSKVWLNAASSLRFPTAFNNNERRVELTGEGYFEVAPMVSAVEPGSAHPERSRRVSFIVAINNKAEVEVLGTHFNINAYQDEAGIRTTLLEGKVKVVNRESSIVNGESAILQPGEQAEITTNHKLQTTNNIDIDEVMAWKNGLFNFNNADIQTVMRQIARWYDVEVVYEGKISTEKFEGEIPRNSQLSEVFKILELSNVHFAIEGKKVIVKP